MAVLAYMGIQGTLSWSNDSEYSDDYSDNIDIKDIPIKYNDGVTPPSNEDFHKAAAESIISFNAERLKYEKISKYPSTHDRLVAIEKQLKLLSDRFEIEQAPEFIELWNQIAKIEEINN